jgi:hypothetical protein
VTDWLASTLLAVPIAPDAQQQQQQPEMQQPQQHVGSSMMLREALLSPAALLSAGNSPGPGVIEQPLLRRASAEAATTPDLQDTGFELEQQQQQQQQRQLEEPEQPGDGGLQEPVAVNARLCGGGGVRGVSCLRDSEHS